MDLDIVLLVEDDAGDALLFERILRRLDLSLTMELVWDGREALKYMEGKAPYEDRKRYKEPRLLVLDLFMPGVDGFGVLRWVRRQARFKDLPVLVLTGTLNPDDIERAYADGANACLEKGSDIDRFEARLSAALMMLLGKSLAAC